MIVTVTMLCLKNIASPNFSPSKSIVRGSFRLLLPLSNTKIVLIESGLKVVVVVVVVVVAIGDVVVGTVQS